MEINPKDVISVINRTIDSYQKMLEEVVIKKGERFDSGPYTHAIQTLYKMLEISDKQV